MSDAPEPIPGLSDLVPGPDPTVRRRLAAGLATLVADARPVLPAASALAPARRRRWTRVAVIALVAAVVAAIILVPLARTQLFGRRASPTATTFPTATTGPTGTEPPPSTTTTVAPSGASGTAPVPAGHSVPIVDLTAISFSDSHDGAALAGQGWSDAAITHDGGRTWTAIAVLTSGTGTSAWGFSGIAFASASVGFVWNDTRILRTTDGGQTWRPLPALPTPHAGVLGATSVSVVGGSFWAIFTCDQDCHADDEGSSLWSWTPSAGWRELPISSQFAGAYAPDLLRLSGGTDLLLAQARLSPDIVPAGRPTGDLFVSHDSGATWSSIPLPCGRIVGTEGDDPRPRFQKSFEVTPYPGSIAASTRAADAAVALTCTGLAMMQREPESVWTLSTLGSGGTWQLRADELGVAGLPNPHVPQDVGTARWGTGTSLVPSLVQAQTAGALWLAGGQTGVFRSTDGGRVWQSLAIGSGGYFPQVQFVDAQHGWCLFNGRALYATSDAGSTWQQLG